MSFLLPNNEEKPYNRCIDCVHIGKKCDGPDFLAMEIHRLCEWARLRKEYLHRKDAKWINAYVAERAEMSLTTVNRFFSGDIDDLKFSTAARILRVLVDGTWGQYPCAMVTDGDDAADLEAECARLREQLKEEKSRTAYLMDRDKFKEEQLIAKDRVISERGDFVTKQRKDIVILAALLGISVSIIIIALAVDLFNPNVGFFWLT